MIAPLLSYVTFNRLGLTEKSLSSILNTSDNFEMYIVDNNSTDGTWKYIQSLKDKRIKSRMRLPVNLGQVYALNLNLSKRRENQYFISVDSDVVIETKDWITRFIKVFKNSPDIGLLSAHVEFPPKSLPPIIPETKNNLDYLKLDKTLQSTIQDYSLGSCVCLKPELIEKIGYWSEENNFGNTELLFRVNHFTPFKVGIILNVKISMPQKVNCEECAFKDHCQLVKAQNTCFTIYEKLYKNDVLKEQFEWKFEETKKDLLSGARSAYCSSLFSYNSTDDEIYNTDWATENFHFFVEKAN